MILSVWVAVWDFSSKNKSQKKKGLIPLWNLPSSSSMSKSSGSWPWHGRHAISVKSKRANSDGRRPASLGDLIFFDPVSLFLLAAFPRWTTLSAPVSPSSTEENGMRTTFPWDMECQWCLVTSGDRDEPPPSSSIRSCSWCSSSNIFLTFELLPPVVMGISVMWVGDPYFYFIILLFCVCVHVILLDGGKKRCRAGSPTRLRVTLLPLVCRTLMMPKVTDFQLSFNRTKWKWKWGERMERY